MDTAFNNFDRVRVKSTGDEGEIRDWNPSPFLPLSSYWVLLNGRRVFVPREDLELITRYEQTNPADIPF